MPWRRGYKVVVFGQEKKRKKTFNLKLRPKVIRKIDPSKLKLECDEGLAAKEMAAKINFLSNERGADARNRFNESPFLAEKSFYTLFELPTNCEDSLINNLCKQKSGQNYLILWHIFEGLRHWN
jgi:hypothetical protein